MNAHVWLVLVLFYSAFAFAASADEWRQLSIYQFVTDRFAHPESDILPPCDTTERVYCGGTWAAAAERLDYIDAMGFTAIWISPVVAQVEGKTGVGEAYHGYWGKNIYALNARFGSEDDFKRLISAAHERGMRVMLDIALNHFAANPGDTIQYEGITPFNNERYFHPKREIDWGNQLSIEMGWMGDGYLWLPDTNTEDDEVVETLVAWVKHVVNKYEIDGLRLDAARNVPMPFWRTICTEAGVYCQGEVWAKDPNIVCPYQECMDGLHNYPFMELATQAFASSAGNIEDFVDVARQMQSRCNDVTLFGTFMENHDNPRLGSITTDFARLQTLAVLNILSDGIPIVYYGQEQLLTGGNDPLNREALWLTRYSTTNNLVPTFTTLNAFRNLLVTGPSPFTQTLSVYNVLGTNLLSVRKGNVVLVLTNSGSGVATNVTVPGFAADEYLVEILTCTILQADDDGQLRATLIGRPVVLYPRTLLASGICQF
ncbi:Alpha-amylase [Mycena chlorophos]|uniref:Alpha-amylase n=1 Tax=Mycena chlorophos TaxID=658473 RepID=A0A8H6T3X6_MYCCL|nr:Alpha-amylase [Mycena chlorophos]